MAFLRNLLAAILGTLMALGIVFFMFLIFISLAGSEEPVNIKKHSVLELSFPYPVNEYAGNDPSDPLAGLFDVSQGLDEITKAIRLAADDDRIDGISLSGPYLLAGISQTRAIRQALADFRESGKFIYAYGDFFMQKDYYLSSVADSIFMNPAGQVEFKGLAAEVLYFQDFQDKTGVRMEVVRHGKYKSAVEPFLSDSMSEENRQQISELLGSIWSSIRGEIAASRGLEETELDRIADVLLARTPERAVSSGLIDGLLYEDEYNDLLATASGADDGDPIQVSLQDYIRATKGKRLYTGESRIAIIYAQGEILYGDGGPDFIGQAGMQEVFKRVRDDEDIKAVVLRINSPGGNALSSEVIWREITQTRKKKPVVVSLSDVAASGGYYMAVGGDRILAEPTTITGSIGVFATIPNISGLSEKIGVNAEQVGTHDLSVDYSFFEPMSDEFRKVLRDGIEDTYQTFLQRVADGRGISLARADSLAQGRVWSGTEAVRLGLVDSLGGMPEALDTAAELAGIDSYRTLSLPKYKSGLERLMEDLGGTGEAAQKAVLKNQLGDEWAQILGQIKAQMQRKGIQARLPFTLEIR
ncbi:signal peptide peptidase SppA [Robiginitalea sp. SC105]|uniref:signal peptide peptidase SppA n=1 Tax=Robiginitalea sp. SC105 TaxID=2762332 RepID=UPI00163A36DB|nr:signal peptide peptidase SppA [Robiginitalea sp. SC105]MBC2838887.1 signal peptide peptidase SppA [Robiginitalea sp. SC105]